MDVHHHDSETYDQLYGVARRNQTCHNKENMRENSETDMFLHNRSNEVDSRTSTNRDWTRESLQPMGKNTIIWYTDGSKTSEGTRAGVFGPRTKYSEPIGQFRSVFTG